MASVIFDAIHDNVATKADVWASEAAPKADIVAVNARTDLIEHRLPTMVVGFGALFAALHYWPPHG